MVAAPSDVSDSSAAVLHCCEKLTLCAKHEPFFSPHWSCHNPWSWFFASTVHAKVSPVCGFTASVPRKMGHVVDPVEAVLVGQSCAVRFAPGCEVMRVHVTPLPDW